jgi:hypothetical protein
VIQAAVIFNLSLSKTIQVILRSGLFGRTARFDRLLIAAAVLQQALN